MAKKRDIRQLLQLDTSSVTIGIAKFREYAAKLKGDEKGEAQLFLDRLFQAFGHPGTIEAGAVPEDRLKSNVRSTRFLDLHWPGRVLFEMKKRGERLERHYDQAFQYWMNLVPQRPPYVVLCNFDELWIYDFNVRLDEPMDRVEVAELEKRWTPLRFLLPTPKAPLFHNNVVEVTRKSADSMAELFQTLVHRGEERDRAQRFVLQCVVAMFSEDVDLLPRATFTDLCADIITGKGSSYDLIGSLFRQMNSPTPARGGRFQGVRYFNGGLFSIVDPIDLTPDEAGVVQKAAEQNWGNVHPAIFGSLFQASMEADERHAFGAHFTSEADIQKVVEPTISRPWRERIESASTLKEMKDIRRDMAAFRVLDPACGSGNFLYVAYRSMKRLERQLLNKVSETFSFREAQRMEGTAISLRQFMGIDILPYAVDLARVTMILAKETILVEQKGSRDQSELQIEPPLPLDNLDDVVVKGDALLKDWPDADVIIGNPPYQSKNKIQKEMGPAYIRRIRAAHPEVPGMADFCVYWFRKTHDHLKPGGRAGLVGTNTIRQNQSRVGGLEHIVANGGTITEAVSTQVWSGEAVVHVSIVNWTKGAVAGKKVLFAQIGDNLDSPWKRWELPEIGPSLTHEFDVSFAGTLRVNSESCACYQGQTHGHEGFLLSEEEARSIIAKSKIYTQIIRPYMTGDEVLGATSGHYLQRRVIDFSGFDAISASKFKILYERVQKLVLPYRERAARERRRNAMPRRSKTTRKLRSISITQISSTSGGACHMREVN